MNEDTSSDHAKSGKDSAAAVPPKGDPIGPLEASLQLQDGAESGVASFCEAAFVSPESARHGSNALLQAFDNSGLWLANLVQPAHLLAEVRQSCCTLTRVIVAQWTSQGETHKLSRLGAALLETDPPVHTHEAGQIMALLASLLAVLRPARAQSLLETSRPLLKDSSDLALLNEANEWVAIGSILEDLSSEDRIFWNRRLREPTEEWDWDTAEARGALLRLAPLMQALEDEDLTPFQRTVPGCWWDAIHETKAAIPAAGSQPPKTGSWWKNAAIFVAGLLVGSLGLVAVAMWHQQHQAADLGIVTQAPETALPVALAAPVQDTTPPSKDPAEPKSAAQPKAAAQQKQTPEPKAAEIAMRMPAASLDVPGAITALFGSTTPSKPPQARARQAALAKLARENAGLRRVHSVVKVGSLRENETLISGRGSMAPAGSPNYRALISWLMLDPPDNAEVRLAVAKIATRALSADELVNTLKMCIYPGSPNDLEARKCADWSLELGGDNLTEPQRRQLKALATALVKS